MAEKLGDRYQIVGELGRGGMGVVFRAKDELLHREVAIKQLSLDLGDEAVLGRDQALQRFLIEARAAANLQHPNVVTLYDVVDAHPPYIVMEYVEGDTLRDMVEGDSGPIPLSLKDACIYVEAICRGLTSAHDRGMVHRDIKPENVMITGGTAKVLDFGLAQIPIGKKAQENEPLLGTPGYMAPEQIMGEKATPASDIFAVACVFVFALTGADPFKGSSVKEILTKTVKEDLDLSELPVGAGLRPVLNSALSKNPTDRPTAAELGDALNLGKDESVDRYSSFMAGEAEDELPPGWGVPPPAGEGEADSSSTIDGLLANISTEAPPPGSPALQPSGYQAASTGGFSSVPPAAPPAQTGGFPPVPAAQPTSPPPAYIPPSGQQASAVKPSWGAGASSAGKSYGGAGPGGKGGATRWIIAGVAVAVVIVIILLMVIK